jgi:hypothetical protein
VDGRRRDREGAGEPCGGAQEAATAPAKKVLGSSRGGEGPHGAREVVWVVEERWSRADRGLHRGGVAMATAESKAEWWRQVLA